MESRQLTLIEMEYLIDVSLCSCSVTKLMRVIVASWVTKWIMIETKHMVKNAKIENEK